MNNAVVLIWLVALVGTLGTAVNPALPVPDTPDSTASFVRVWIICCTLVGVQTSLGYVIRRSRHPSLLEGQGAYLERLQVAEPGCETPYQSTRQDIQNRSGHLQPYPGSAGTPAIVLQLPVDLSDQSPAALASRRAARKLLIRFAPDIDNPHNISVYACRGGKVLTWERLTWLGAASKFTPGAIPDQHTFTRALGDVPGLWNWSIGLQNEFLDWFSRPRVPGAWEKQARRWAAGDV